MGFIYDYEFSCNCVFSVNVGGKKNIWSLKVDFTILAPFPSATVVKRVSYALQSSFCAENPNKWCVILNICATRSRGQIFYLGTCFWIPWFGVIADIWHLWKSSKSSNNYPRYYEIVFSSFSSNLRILSTSFKTPFIVFESAVCGQKTATGKNSFIYPKRKSR